MRVEEYRVDRGVSSVKLKKLRFATTSIKKQQPHFSLKLLPLLILVDFPIAATIMNNGDSYSSRGMAPSSSSTKSNKQEPEDSTNKRPSADTDRHNSSRDYPVRYLLITSLAVSLISYVAQ